MGRELRSLFRNAHCSPFEISSPTTRPNPNPNTHSIIGSLSSLLPTPSPSLGKTPCGLPHSSNHPVSSGHHVSCSRPCQDSFHPSVYLGHPFYKQLHFYLCLTSVLNKLFFWRRQWQPTPVLLAGESQGRGSLVGCRLWGRKGSDTTEVT